jgi:uncharacterized SAM-binding protein YcdF (DUF218 family)
MNALKSLAELTFSPLGLMTFFLCGGFILSILGRTSRWGRRFLVTGAFLFFLFTLSPLAEILVRSLERHYSPLLTPPASIPIKRIVVLSAYAEQYSTIPVTSNLYEESLFRLVEGIRLYRCLPGSNLILSGGSLRHQDKPVASIMADFVREMGVPDKDILVEGRSLNTYENLVEVKKIIGSDPFILVASACVLRRAMAVAWKLGMHPIAAPAHIWTLQHYPAEMDWTEWPLAVLDGFGFPDPVRLNYLQLAYHEYLGYAWYRLLGWI